MKNDTGITCRRSRKRRRRIRGLLIIHKGECEDRKKEKVNEENKEKQKRVN
jgi:hypothetical protein